MFTFIKICIVLGVLGKGETVGDLQPVIDNQAQEDALNHLTSLALFLVMLDNFQHHLEKHRKVGKKKSAIWFHEFRMIKYSETIYRTSLINSIEQISLF